MKKFRGIFMRLGKVTRSFLLMGALLSILVGTVALFSPTTIYAIINRAVGSNTVAGKGIRLGGDGVDTIHVEAGYPLSFHGTNDSLTIAEDVIFKLLFGDEDWGDISVATNVVTIDEDVIDAANFANGDWGDITVTTNVITIDNGVVEAADLKAEDFGDFTVAAGVATLDADVVADNEIDYSAVTLDDFDYQTPWRVFYSNADGDMTELALGADGTYLKSNGAAVAPTFATPPGGDPGGAINDSITYGYQIYQKIDTTTAKIPTAEYADSAGLIADDAVDQWDLKTVNEPVDEDIFTYESTTGDFEWHTPAELGLATEAAMGESLWTFDQFCDGFEFSLRTGSDAVTEITVYDNLANDSVGHFARHVHTGTTADKVDTVVASRKLPMGMDGTGVDSVTYNIRTSHVADSVYVQIKVWKRTTELGALVFCDSVAAIATTAGAWEHKTTGALAVAANAGNELEVWFIVTFPSQTANIVLVDHSKPRAYYTGR